MERGEVVGTKRTPRRHRSVAEKRRIVELALQPGVLEQQPFSGHVFVFRGRRGDTIKILWFDGDGPRTLTEWDFLLGVHDETRLGALRFKRSSGPYVDSDTRFAAPPLTSLRELQAASLQFERHLNDEEHPEYAKWLAQLIAPGSSLGGARPKASVRDEKGALCIAKFPSRQDKR